MVERTQGVTHEPCPKCGSKDNLGRYPDGHAYCFGDGCSYYEHGSDSGDVQDIPKSNGVFRQGIYESLSKRGISEETCRFFKYQVNYDNNKKIHIAPYFDKEKILECLRQGFNYNKRSFESDIKLDNNTSWNGLPGIERAEQVKIPDFRCSDTQTGSYRPGICWRI